MEYLKTRISFIYQYLWGLVNKGHERSVNAKKNILVSFLIRGGSIGVTLLLVPMTIQYINPTKYGIWLTLSSIISWFSFFDIGFGNGLRNKFAESLARGNTKLARIYVSTTYAILSIIILVVLTLFFVINPFLDWSKILNTPAEMASELSLLALVVFSFFCIQFVLNLLTIIITADQQPAKASFLSFLGNFLSLIIIFLLVKFTKGNLIYLGAALSIAPVFVLILSTLWFFSRDYKDFSPSFKHIKFGHAKDLMGLGLKFFVIQIAAIVLFQTSNIIITQLFGPTQVTPYNIAFKYFSIVSMLLGIIISPFWSAYTEAWVKEDFDWIKKTMKNLKLLWLLLSLMTLFMLLCSNFVYRLWIGPSVEVPFLLSLMMAAYIITLLWNTIYAQFLNGVGKIKLELYSGIWGMILNIPMAIYFGKKIGISGVILSGVILGLINMVWTNIQYNKLINKKAKGIWNQ